MSAPGPRAGSSGRNGRCSSAPVEVLAASRASVPGSDPTPVAAPTRSGKDSGLLTAEAYGVGNADGPGTGRGAR